MRIIGRKPVLELLESGAPVQKVKVQLGTQGRVIGQIIKLAKSRGVPVDRVPPQVAKKAFGGGNHQGVIAETAPTPLRNLDELGSETVPVRYGLLVVLDGITDPHHLGAIARSALAAGCDGLVLPARRAAPVSDTAIKASAGTLTRMPIIQVTSLPDTLRHLKDQGWWIVGTEGANKGSHSVWEHDWDKQTVLVIGSEGEGMSRLVGELCDHHVAIPMAADVDSLSASAAASVILFDVARKRGNMAE
jgi:23S rRNA (guanosine2251-2'-O)-methyltransferase